MQVKRTPTESPERAMQFEVALIYLNNWAMGVLSAMLLARLREVSNLINSDCHLK